MKRTKIEAKQIAQTAKSITRVECFGGQCSEQEVTFEAMLDELKHSKTWWSDQFPRALFINISNGLSFVVMP